MVAPDTPITQLLRRAAAGDRAALDAVFGDLYPELRRLAHARLRGRGDGLGTTTLVHESFLRLVQSSGLRLEDRHHFFTYAAKTMRNLIIDDRRSARVRRELATEEVPDRAYADQTDAALDTWLVTDALAQLSDEHRRVIVYAYYVRRSIAEIATELGIPQGTVKSRLHYGIRALRLALQERGVTNA